MKRSTKFVALVTLVVVLTLQLVSCGGPYVKLRLAEDTMLGESYKIIRRTAFSSDNETLNAALSEITFSSETLVDKRNYVTTSEGQRITYHGGCFYFELDGKGSYRVKMTNEEAIDLFGEAAPPYSETPCESIKESLGDEYNEYTLVGVPTENDDEYLELLKAMTGGDVSAKSHDITVQTGDRGIHSVREIYVFDIILASGYVSVEVNNTVSYLYDDPPFISKPDDADFTEMTYGELKSLLHPEE